MSERTETRQYTLTVEGETEKMYFDWLQKEINTSGDAKYKVKINASIQQFPLSYIKKLNTKSRQLPFSKSFTFLFIKMDCGAFTPQPLSESDLPGKLR